MSEYDETLKHPVSGRTVETYKGWSWPAFFFTPIWFFIKGFSVRAIVYILISLVTFGIGGLLYSFIAGVNANDWYYEKLIDRGYKPYRKHTSKKKLSEQ